MFDGSDGFSVSTIAVFLMVTIFDCSCPTLFLTLNVKSAVVGVGASVKRTFPVIR